MTTTKHIIALVIISLLVLLLSHYVYIVISHIAAVHDWFSDDLKIIFTASSVGKWFRELFAMLALPLIVGLVPAGLYWGMKKQPMPYLVELIWVVWLVQTTAVIIMANQGILQI